MPIAIIHSNGSLDNNLLIPSYLPIFPPSHLSVEIKYKNSISFPSTSGHQNLCFQFQYKHLYVQQNFKEIFYKKKLQFPFENDY